MKILISKHSKIYAQLKENYFYYINNGLLTYMHLSKNSLTDAVIIKDFSLRPLTLLEFYKRKDEIVHLLDEILR